MRHSTESHRCRENVVYANNLKYGNFVYCFTTTRFEDRDAIYLHSKYYCKKTMFKFKWQTNFLLKMLLERRSRNLFNIIYIGVIIMGSKMYPPSMWCGYATDMKCLRFGSNIIGNLIKSNGNTICGIEYTFRNMCVRTHIIRPG